MLVSLLSDSQISSGSLVPNWPLPHARSWQMPKGGKWVNTVSSSLCFFSTILALDKFLLAALVCPYCL